MNGPWLHLVTNHIPVLGVPFALALLAAGWRRKSRELTGAGFVVLVGTALAAVVAYRAGGAAADFIWDLPGVPHDPISAHGDAAKWGLVVTELLGAAGLGGLWAIWKTGEAPQGMTLASMAIAAGASAWLGYVAHLGGLIRHPEIDPGYRPPAPAPASTPAK